MLEYLFVTRHCQIVAIKDKARVIVEVQSINIKTFWDKQF